jgi:hypothetical protein
MLPVGGVNCLPHRSNMLVAEDTEFVFSCRRYDMFVNTLRTCGMPEPIFFCYRYIVPKGTLKQ